MSHHLSAPNLTSPMGDARLDMTDLFAFPARLPDRTVLILDCNPIAPTQGDAFHPGAVYKIHVDTDGDNRADIAYCFTFSARDGDTQMATVRRCEGEQARSFAAEGRQIAAGAVSFGDQPNIVEEGPYRFAAGLRSDPFFADLDGIVKGFQWTGVDWGADKNILGMVLEVPDADLGGQPVVGLWGRVSVTVDGTMTSVDRGAHPSLTAYFNAEDVKDQYNAGSPDGDWAGYADTWAQVLQHTGEYSPEAAKSALRTVLPDVLRYDRSRPAIYPNGRTLTDDVTSARLNMLTNGKVPTDNIPPHKDLLPDFPYLGKPHPVMAAAKS